MTDPLPPDLTKRDVFSLVILHALLTHSGFPQHSYIEVGRAVAKLAEGVMEGLEPQKSDDPEISQAGA